MHKKDSSSLFGWAGIQPFESDNNLSKGNDAFGGCFFLNSSAEGKKACHLVALVLLPPRSL